MPANKKQPASKFPLRLMPSVRQAAEAFSTQEGVSLNQFINVAVAEKLAHLQHERWVSRRKPATEQAVSEALAILGQGNSDIPDEEQDRLPARYVLNRP